jgi:predicted nuclease of predicted toxin-antitoxin system
VKFLVDAQLPPSLADLLRRAGHEARHVDDLGLRTASDQAICDAASVGQYIVITKDEDFSALQPGSATIPVVVWVRIGNCTTQMLLAAFERVLPDLESKLRTGEYLIEIQ